MSYITRSPPQGNWVTSGDLDAMLLPLEAVDCLFRIILALAYLFPGATGSGL
jgi:hypothetical protein